MSARFVMTDVSPELLMDIAKVLSQSPHPLSKEDIAKSLEDRYRNSYVFVALTQAVQLGLATKQKDLFLSSEKPRDLIKRSEKSQLYLPFRALLQEFPPFLLFADFISKGYSPENAATMTRGILKIESPRDKVERALRIWGMYAQLIQTDPQSGRLSIPEAEQGLPSEYVKNLLKALQDELKAGIFIIETLSPPAYAYLTQKGISITDLSKALVNYEKDPKPSANSACQTFEFFLYKLGEDVGANVTKCRGVIELTNEIKGQKTMLLSHMHICHGIGGLRNVTSHSPDNETGNPWTVTPQGALSSLLSVPTAIRSLYLFWKEQKQEF